ncbi:MULTISPECIES: SRPBCC family protein [Bacteria]
MRSHHVSRVINAPAEVVYAYALKVENLPAWAAGLAQSDVTRDGDDLVVASPMGPVRVRFVERNPFGVLDHDVTLPSGTVVTNPLRVVAHPEGSEVIFTVRQIELTDDEFARDIRMVEADLDRLAARVSPPTA